MVTGAIVGIALSNTPIPLEKRKNRAQAPQTIYITCFLKVLEGVGNFVQEVSDKKSCFEIRITRRSPRAWLAYADADAERGTAFRPV